MSTVFEDARLDAPAATRRAAERRSRQGAPLSISGVLYGFLLVGIFSVSWQIARPGDLNFTISDGAFLVVILGLVATSRFNLTPMEGFSPAWIFALILMLGRLFVSTVVNGEEMRWLVVALQYSFAYLLLPMMFASFDQKTLQHCVVFYILGVTFSSEALCALCIGLLGACAGTAYITGFAILQEHVTEDLRGRTFASLAAVVLQMAVAKQFGPENYTKLDASTVGLPHPEAVAALLSGRTEIVGHFAYWDDIEIHFRGTTHRIGGNGFCGTSRSMLLKILGRRAHSLGIEVKYQTEIDPTKQTIRGADLVVAADGVNSKTREAFANFFKPDIGFRPNHFAWMGSTKPLDAFNFFFRETEHGIFIAHCYQYQPGRSTWIFETDPETFQRAGLGKLDEQGSAQAMERVFAEELDGHSLITNRSIWRNFPTIRCERWTHDNTVLLGDAKATAHFSIGSGTKLAMEDSIALFKAFQATGGRDVKAALARFESARREEVEKTQHSADVSLVWFEHVKRFWDMDPTRFAFGLMTRSKAITARSACPASSAAVPKR